MKILIPLTVQFSVRYVIRTGLLEKIRAYAEPVIVLAWQDEVLKIELEDQGITVHYLPEKKYGLAYYRIRQQLTVWHLGNVNSPTTAIDQRRLNLEKPLGKRIRGDIKQGIYSSLTSIPGYVGRLQAKEKEALFTDTNINEYLALIRDIQPDLVFCMTPYFIEEEFLLRAAELEGIPLVTSILSFDNLTTRGWIVPKFEAYYLWNQYNVNELHRIYPETKDKLVEVVGAPQFDFYYNDKNLWDEVEWRSALGLPTDAPVILFGAGPINITPHEPMILKALDEAITQKRIKNDPVILFRRHPVEPIDRWQEVLSTTKNVIVDEPWKNGRRVPGKTNISMMDIEKLCSTLRHSEVHINTSSTMTIDGAIYDRPQIGPGFSLEKKYRRIAYELYLREHYLPITHSGGLEIPLLLDEMVDMINEGFDEPRKGYDGRKKLIKEIATFDDGQSTDRVNTVCQKILM